MNLSSKTHAFRVSLLALLLLIPLGAWAIPQTLSYQGYLTDASGAPLTGAHSLTFSLYTVSSGGTAQWSETQGTVQVSNGLFTVELGNGTAFPLDLFATPLWLGISVDGDPEMSPRTPLSSGGYAFKAEDADRLEGVSASSLDQSAHVADMGNPHGVTAAQVGAADATVLNNHLNDTGNPHGVTAAQAGAVDTASFTAHTGNPAAHHVPYTDSAAVAAIIAADGAGSTLDADFLDGLDGSAFVRTTGGTINGDLSTIGRVSANEFTILARGISFPDGSIQTSAAAKAKHVSVAPTGGDYSTIQAAIDAINPTADGPYVIDVAPGTYSETVRMKSHVHLRGAGRDATMLSPDFSASTEPGAAAIVLGNLVGVTISGFTLNGMNGLNPDGTFGIFDDGSSPVIRDNRIVGFRGGCLSTGQYPCETAIHSQNSTPRITGNIIEDSGVGIFLRNATAYIDGNSFASAGGAGQCGLRVEGSRASIIGNSFNNGEEVCLASYSTLNSAALILGNDFVDMTKSIDVGSGQNARISGNKISGQCDTGISNLGEATIVGNHISTCGIYGIINTGTSTVIADNMLNNNAMSGGSQVASLSGSAVISGNYLDGGGGTGSGIISGAGGASVISSNIVHSHAIGISASGGDTVTGNQVFNNTSNISGSPAVSIGNRILNGTSIGESVSAPDGFSIDSAAGVISISAGTSTITIVPSGQISISSNADLSITASGALNLSGDSVNITSANAMQFSAGTNLTAQSSMGTNITSGGSINATAGGVMDINGSLINLN